MLGAGVAIVATIALSPAPLLAQDATATPPTPSTATLPPAAPPPIDGPIITADTFSPATTTPEPQIIIPEAVNAPAPITTSAPVVQPVPETATEPAPAEAFSPTPAPREPVATRSGPAASTQVTEPTPAAEEPQPLNETLAEEAVVAPAAMSTLPAADAPAEPAETTPGQETDVVGMIGAGVFLLVILLLGLAALLLVRNSRRKAKRPVVTRPKPAAAAATANRAEPVEAPRAEPPLRQEVPIAATATPLATYKPAVRTSRSASGAAVLPRQMPATFEERDALLRRMIDAKPDKANPFTDRRARLKRARLILQSLGRKFETNKPWIDLSDYPENWPALSRRYARAA